MKEGERSVIKMLPHLKMISMLINSYTNKGSDRNMEVKLPTLLTKRTTADRPVYREVSLPIYIQTLPSHIG